MKWVLRDLINSKSSNIAMGARKEKCERCAIFEKVSHATVQGNYICRSESVRYTVVKNMEVKQDWETESTSIARACLKTNTERKILPFLCVFCVDL